jgi:signal transduction histidine kinase
MAFPHLPPLSQLDGVALDSRKLGPSRLATAVVVTGLVGPALGWPVALVWGAAVLACEGWMWVVTIPFARGRPIGRGLRLAFMLQPIVGAAVWLGLSLAFWRDPHRGSQFLALVIWSALLLNAISFAFRSALALILLATPVSLVMILTPLVAPRFSVSQQVTADVGMVVLVVYAAISAGRNVKAARLLAEAGEALERARRAAETANAAKSDFLATMSHEIRTPLNGVIGMAQAMVREDLATPQRERLAVIRQGGETLLALLDDLLDLARIESGRLELEDGVIDLEMLAGSAQATFTSLAADKGVSIRLAVAQPTRGLWRGDPVRVRQVLYNLVSNAVKFTAEGAVNITLALEGGHLVITVSDTGLGIAPESLAALFDRFVQVDASTTRRFGGSGLGLAICRELCQLMGGSITVESEVGRGSVFTARLPLERAPADTRAAEPQAAATPGEAFPVLVGRVLAAEDNRMNQLVLQTVLGQFGLQVTFVGNGLEAVEAHAREPWDVILMDVQMPVMDGPAAARRIRAHEREQGRPATLIIALTANAMTHQEAEYLEAGMDAVVAKPIRIPQLLAAISRALGSEPGAREGAVT